MRSGTRIGTLRSYRRELRSSLHELRGNSERPAREAVRRHGLRVALEREGLLGVVPGPHELVLERFVQGVVGNAPKWKGMTAGPLVVALVVELEGAPVAPRAHGV